MLSRDDIVAVCPPPKSGSKRAIWDGYVAALLSPEGVRLLRSYGITTPNRMIGLVACVFAPETGLTLIFESGAYTPQGLYKTFGPHRHSAKITLAEAEKICARTGVISLGNGQTAPVKDYLIFERVYGIGNPKKAKELGNVNAGDGYLFRGLGLPQLTGRWAHENTAKKIGCSLFDLAKPINCLHMALIEWDEKKCNGYADRQDWVSIRKLINAGSTKVSISRVNGLPEMTRALAIAQRVITPADFETLVAANDEPPPPPPPSSAPLALWGSTEAQMAVTTGGGGVATTGQAAQNAVMKTASSGDWSWKMFALNLLSDGLFWTGMLAIAGGAYWFLKRRATFYIRGH